VKRSPLKRGKSLARGTSTLKRAARVRPTGRRGLEDRKALDLVRPVVMERAGGRCERCLRVRRLDVHHLRSRAQGGTHEASNLVALCSGPDGCHGQVHAHLIPDWREWIARRGG